MTVPLGSGVTILSVCFEEMRLLGQIADSHETHSGPTSDVRMYL
jgi:hypothetical protein